MDCKASATRQTQQKSCTFTKHCTDNLTKSFGGVHGRSPDRGHGYDVPRSSNGCIKLAINLDAFRRFVFIAVWLLVLLCPLSITNVFWTRYFPLCGYRAEFLHSTFWLESVLTLYSAVRGLMMIRTTDQSNASIDRCFFYVCDVSMAA